MRTRLPLLKILLPLHPSCQISVLFGLSPLDPLQLPRRLLPLERVLVVFGQLVLDVVRFLFPQFCRGDLLLCRGYLL